MSYVLVAWLVVLSVACWRLSKRSDDADGNIGQIAEYLCRRDGLEP